MQLLCVHIYIFDSLRILHHTPQFHSVLRSSMSTLHLCIPPRKKFTSLLHLSLLSIIYLFTIMSLETAVCHIVYSSYKQHYLQMFIVMSCWSGTRTLASAISSILDPHRGSCREFCCCPESWSSFGMVQEDTYGPSSRLKMG